MNRINKQFVEPTLRVAKLWLVNHTEHSTNMALEQRKKNRIRKTNYTPHSELLA